MDAALTADIAAARKSLKQIAILSKALEDCTPQVSASNLVDFAAKSYTLVCGSFIGSPGTHF